MSVTRDLPGKATRILVPAILLGILLGAVILFLILLRATAVQRGQRENNTECARDQAASMYFSKWTSAGHADDPQNLDEFLGLNSSAFVDLDHSQLTCLHEGVS